MNQQTNEEKWREEFETKYCAIKREDDFSWTIYLAACKKRQEESNYRCNDMSGVCLNCGARHSEESSCLKAWINYHLEGLSNAAKEMRSLKNELVQLKQSILWVKSGKAYLDDLVADIERETQAKRKAGL